MFLRLKNLKMAQHHKRGLAGEDLAVEYLCREHYRILQRNYRYGYGEIDIIAEDGNILVFAEVKTFRSKKFGEPEDAVTKKKRDRIRKTAEGYLYQHAIDDKECRFDVIAIDWERTNPMIRHIKDAF